MSARGVALVFLASVAAGCTEAPPPLGEAVVVVDTDVSVPRGIHRLAVDLYSHPDATWIESRDIARPDARDWPVSFSVFSSDETQSTRVWVRLRGYSEGRVRDVLASPRLADTEPAPATSVDRLLLVELSPGDRGRVLTTLEAACAGQESSVAEGRTCEDGEMVNVDVSTVEREVFAEPKSLLADETRAACTPSDDPARVCIPGGASILGSRELFFFPDIESVPERLVTHAPFRIDRDEVTVARYREALAAGFVPTIYALANDGPIDGTRTSGSCTFSNSDLGREDYPLNCISWIAAREMCQFHGGDLPAEAQFERAATLASDFGHSRFAWGDEEPTCDRAVYGRLSLSGFPGVCEMFGQGPLPISANQFDVTREGVFGLAGNLSEWMLDDYRRYSEPCWTAAPASEPQCVDEEAGNKATRGASWAAPAPVLPSAVRLGAQPTARVPLNGFRCVYP